MRQNIVKVGSTFMSTYDAQYSQGRTLTLVDV